MSPGTRAASRVLAKTTAVSGASKRSGPRMSRACRVCSTGTKYGCAPAVRSRASPHQPGVADADGKHEAVRPGFGQRSATVHHRGRVPGPNIGDACGNLDPAGGREDDGPGRKDLAGEVFADPDGTETHLFDLRHRATQVGRREERHRPEPDASAADV